jgi:hypothetical protein
MSMFAVLNYRNLFRRGFCDDCALPYGLPFTFFRGNGFEGGGGIVWTGMISDLLLVLACGAAIAQLLDWVFKAAKPQRTR